MKEQRGMHPWTGLHIEPPFMVESSAIRKNTHGGIHQAAYSAKSGKPADRRPPEIKISSEHYNSGPRIIVVYRALNTFAFKTAKPAQSERVAHDGKCYRQGQWYFLPTSLPAIGQIQRDSTDTVHLQSSKRARQSTTASFLPLCRTRATIISKLEVLWRCTVPTS